MHAVHTDVNVLFPDRNYRHVVFAFDCLNIKYKKDLVKTLQRATLIMLP